MRGLVLLGRGLMGVSGRKLSPRRRTIGTVRFKGRVLVQEARIYLEEMLAKGPLVMAIDESRLVELIIVINL
jgi:hypothetical protein